MKKAVAAQVSLLALALASAALADGPPAGATLRVAFDGAWGKANSYTGGVVTVPQIANGKGQMMAGQPVMSPLKITVSNGMPPAFYSWFQLANGGDTVGHSLAVTSVDAGGKAVGGLQVTNATIQQITFPALSKTDASAATFDVTVGAAGTNASTNVSTPPSSNELSRSTWSKSNFAIALDGLPAPIGMAPISITIPHLTTGQVGGKPQLGGTHLYFDAGSKAAVDAWLAQPHGSINRDVKITYFATALKGEVKSPIYELDLKQCAPGSESFSGNVDVSIVCTGSLFKVSP